MNDIIVHHAAIRSFGVLSAVGPVKKKLQMNWTDHSDTGFLCREPEIVTRPAVTLNLCEGLKTVLVCQACFMADNPYGL